MPVFTLLSRFSKIIPAWVLCCTFLNAAAQPSHYSYGIQPIYKVSAYTNSVRADSLQLMAELRHLIPTLVYDLRYAGANNFVQQPVYPTPTRHSFLRLAPARALQQVQLQLAQQGLGLKMFDAYRPYSVTIRFWELVRDERYVAHPSKASGHNRGLAVDLTIIDLATGKEWEMGTGFDNFSDTAHHNFKQLPPHVLNNRAFLKNVMEQHGFMAYEHEWWHYSWPNNRNYAPLDLSFHQLFTVWKRYR